MYAPPAWTPLPFCSMFNCPYAGEFLFNGRNVCGAHLQQLSQPPAPPAPPLPPPESRPQLQAEKSDTCAFRGCKKSGLCAHGRDYFCREHFTRLLVLDAHVAGQRLPPRTRVNNGGRVVQLCQIGHCTRNGNSCRAASKCAKTTRCCCSTRSDSWTNATLRTTRCTPRRVRRGSAAMWAAPARAWRRNTTASSARSTCRSSATSATAS